jgi:hypothetical protein
VVIGFVLYEMDRSAKILGACWIAVGIVYYAVLRVVLRKSAGIGIGIDGDVGGGRPSVEYDSRKVE